jgi:hypothetical protein
MSKHPTHNGEHHAPSSGFGCMPWAGAQPGEFAVRFNTTVPGAHRLVTADDIRELAHCGLIGRHGFFGHQDLETIRAILRYEQLRQKRLERQGECTLTAPAPGEPDGGSYARGPRSGLARARRAAARWARPRTWATGTKEPVEGADTCSSEDLR